MEDASARVEGSELGIETGAPLIQVKSNLSADHLLAAIYFTRRVRELESSYPAPLEADAGVAHRSYSLGSVITSVGYLEAAINEFYLSAVDRDRNVIGGLSELTTGLLAQLWPEVEAMRTLRKYQLALTFGQVRGIQSGYRPVPGR